MQYRGPILLVFGLSLVMSPFAIRLTEEAKASAPGRVETVGARADACAAATIETSSYVIGCKGRHAATDNRRYTSANGALFVSARN